MAQVEIRLATSNDRESIIQFIDEFWKKDHYFVRNPDFFDYHYGGIVDCSNGSLNFILAVDSISIVGILGYIPYDRERGADISLSLWKVRRSSDPSLGLGMLEFLRETLLPGTLSCTGINKNTLPIYKYLGFRTGMMETFCLVNNEVKDFRILGSSNQLEQIIPLKLKSADIFKIDSVDYLGAGENLSRSAPGKSLSYLRWRYFDHPIFQYECYRATEMSTGQTLDCFCRVVRSQESSFLRIVELVGDFSLFPNFTSIFLELMKESGHEYTELVVGGDFKKNLVGSGFVSTKEKQIVAPLYFQPFVRQNIEIFYFTSTPDAERCYFLGDGDQDRPN